MEQAASKSGASVAAASVAEPAVAESAVAGAARIDSGMAKATSGGKAPVPMAAAKPIINE